jgi:TrmH family RNA methyltransferase
MSSRPQITSAHNTRLKELRKLHERKHREQSGLFLAEGEDMLVAATQHGAQPRAVFYDPNALSHTAGLLATLGPEVELVAVEHDALRTAGTLGSGSRLLGVWEQRWSKPGADVALYLHEVADPGNVGAIVRSALALAPSVVILSPGTADPFSPKAVRASMGAIFGQALVRASFEEARSELDTHRAVALVPGQGRPLPDLELQGQVLFCLGSEREGLPDAVTRDCDEVAHVPLRPGGVQSLNVAMTATLCLYLCQNATHRLSSLDG